ncbi:kinase-like domain-containing protein [Syncephalis pseudoplumigaleata]|uniref:Kinase-like domain-containing protein n=1 Tax=Syncephalis pseudoplumigaleata TaxID=1712513 RepID=A0A4P9YVH9_9FUNG|nr:kinase-like domain-containing protein [Syncephalis pseudoplumigaleata]|eukprot:RKP24073.1 kinase-like domain-containing protein [Syncephalis pseudoplumigaleata]
MYIVSMSAIDCMNRFIVGICATQCHRYLSLEYAPHVNIAIQCKKQRLSERLQKRALKRLLLAVQPRNILFKDIEAGHVVLANFGQAQKHTPAGQYLAAGELAYMAPEMAWCRVAYDGHLRRHLLRSWRANPELRAQLCANHHYGKEADMWCVGLILYYMIYDHNPFVRCSDDYATFIKIINGDIDIEERGGISSEGIEMLRGLLAADKNERLTAAGALASPWLEGIAVPADGQEPDQEQLAR